MSDFFKSADRAFLRRLAIIAAGVVVLAGLAVIFPRENASSHYITEAVTRGPLAVTVRATGTLQPRDQVEVGAEISGRIDEIFADYNDRVTKGQKLAHLNTEQIEAQLAQARAGEAQAQATYTQTAQNYPRTVALAKSNAASKQDLDNARAEMLRARANVNLAIAQVHANQTLLSKATIYSPMDGVVLERKVSRGQTLTATMQTPVLFVLASDLSHMELHVDVAEADVGQLHAGQTAAFTVDAFPGRTFNAKLTSIRSAPKRVRGRVMYEGVLEVANSGGLLKPGMSATARIVAARVADALLVPNAALHFEPPPDAANTPFPDAAGDTRMFTVDDDRLVPHTVKLGASNGHRTQLLHGDLNEGDQVVTGRK
ncbi:MAG: efflux RND transporter periplasmic adaptor subunit [Alphaproteobacteria bacterium]|nr:efflux RND transporter periplasmic adaptor subunit [Alphaproteobacteria bacterium]